LIITIATFSFHAGNVASVSIEYKQQENASPLKLGSQEFVADKSVPGSYEIVFKPYIEALSLTLTVDEPADYDQATYDLHLSVYGCFDLAGICALYFNRLVYGVFYITSVPWSSINSEI